VPGKNPIKYRNVSDGQRVNSPGTPEKRSSDGVYQRKKSKNKRNGFEEFISLEFVSLRMYFHKKLISSNIDLFDLWTWHQG
jgi:hypothetical protein